MAQAKARTYHFNPVQRAAKLKTPLPANQGGWRISYKACQGGTLALKMPMNEISGMSKRLDNRFCSKAQFLCISVMSAVGDAGYRKTGNDNSA